MAFHYHVDVSGLRVAARTKSPNRQPPHFYISCMVDTHTLTHTFTPKHSHCCVQNLKEETAPFAPRQDPAHFRRKLLPPPECSRGGGGPASGQAWRGASA